MPTFALANLNWLGRLTCIQKKLLGRNYLGHRLLMSLPRAVTTKVIFRPVGHQPGRTVWQDAYRAKGMKGSGTFRVNPFGRQHWVSGRKCIDAFAVSYTHLTLPTIYSV